MLTIHNKPMLDSVEMTKLMSPAEREAWDDFLAMSECGNDSVVSWYFEWEDAYPVLSEFLKRNGISDDIEIHVWW